MLRLLISPPLTTVQDSYHINTHNVHSHSIYVHTPGGHEDIPLGAGNTAQ